MDSDKTGKEVETFADYKAGDEVVATVDFQDDTNGFTEIAKGTTDVVESVSSNHHGGLQLNLVKHGRGWSNHVWRKQDVAPKTTLAQEMHLLFDEDEQIKEWILIGKLPPDIAEIAADAMSRNGKRPISTMGAPDHYMHVAQLIQLKFFPKAPPLERGGFMTMMAGGPAPDWFLWGQISDQIVDVVKEHGYDVEAKPALMEDLTEDYN